MKPCHFILRIPPDLRFQKFPGMRKISCPVRQKAERSAIFWKTAQFIKNVLREMRKIIIRQPFIPALKGKEGSCDDAHHIVLLQVRRISLRQDFARFPDAPESSPASAADRQHIHQNHQIPTQRLPHQRALGNPCSYFPRFFLDPPLVLVHRLVRAVEDVLIVAVLERIVDGAADSHSDFRPWFGRCAVAYALIGRELT